MIRVQKHEFTHLCYFQAQAGGVLGVTVPPGRGPLLVLLAARWDWLCSSAGIQLCRRCRLPWSLLQRGAALSAPRPAGFAHQSDSGGSTSAPAATLPHLRDRCNTETQSAQRSTLANAPGRHLNLNTGMTQGQDSRCRAVRTSFKALKYFPEQKCLLGRIFSPSHAEKSQAVDLLN